MNDGIDSELCSLKYVSVDDAVTAVQQKGPGAQLAKIDIRNAYRIIPVHPEDRWLLGMTLMLLVVWAVELGGILNGCSISGQNQVQLQTYLPPRKR